MSLIFDGGSSGGGDVQGIETTTTGGNVELSATEGVLTVETPDGAEDKQVANVEFVNNLVGDVANILSEV